LKGWTLAPYIQTALEPATDQAPWACVWVVIILIFIETVSFLWKELLS